MTTCGGQEIWGLDLYTAVKSRQTHWETREHSSLKNHEIISNGPGTAQDGEGLEIKDGFCPQGTWASRQSCCLLIGLRSGNSGNSEEEKETPKGWEGRGGPEKDLTPGGSKSWAESWRRNVISPGEGWRERVIQGKENTHCGKEAWGRTFRN